MASAKQLNGDLNHTNVFKSLNYKTGNFLLKRNGREVVVEGREIQSCF